MTDIAHVFQAQKVLPNSTQKNVNNGTTITSHKQVDSNQRIHKINIGNLPLYAEMPKVRPTASSVLETSSISRMNVSGERRISNEDVNSS